MKNVKLISENKCKTWENHFLRNKNLLVNTNKSTCDEVYKLPPTMDLVGKRKLELFVQYRTCSTEQSRIRLAE